MGNIIACYKWVVDEEDIRVDPADLSVDLSKAKSKISEYDRNGIQAAILAGRDVGEKVVALTYGAQHTRQSVKDALSRGPAEGYWVNDASAEQADGFVTANILAAAIRKISDYSLIICAEGAADTYARQVGPRIGTILDIPVLSSVTSLTINGNEVIAVRKLDNSMQTVKAALPVLVTVLPEVCEAPIPGLKAVLEAGKKPLHEWKISDLDIDPAELIPKRKVKGLRGYAANRKQCMISGDDTAGKVRELVEALKREGVL